jgi:hypothetical protein
MCFADRDVADAELLLQVGIANPLPWLDGTGNNGPSQAFRNAINDRFGNWPRPLNLFTHGRRPSTLNCQEKAVSPLF